MRIYHVYPFTKISNISIPSDFIFFIQILAISRCPITFFNLPRHINRCIYLSISIASTSTRRVIAYLDDSHCGVCEFLGVEFSVQWPWSQQHWQKPFIKRDILADPSRIEPGIEPVPPEEQASAEAAIFMRSLHHCSLYHTLDWSGS